MMKVFLSKRLVILLMYKEATLLTNSGTQVLSSTIDSLLQEFYDIVVKNMPVELPPLEVLNIRLTSYRCLTSKQAYLLDQLRRNKIVVAVNRR